jgi:hypothetical protein
LNILLKEIKIFFKKGKNAWKRSNLLASDGWFLLWICTLTLNSLRASTLTSGPISSVFSGQFDINLHFAFGMVSSLLRGDFISGIFLDTALGIG